jgi:putative SOS response-associated peptidase YedK
VVVCGRFTSTSTPEDVAAFFDVDDVRTDALAVRYNVAPTDAVYAVALGRSPTAVEPGDEHRAVEPGDEHRAAHPARHRILGAFKWGLVPSWADGPTTAGRMINARAEGITSKPAYRSAIARRRCLIPADAFYEWKRRSTPEGRPAGRLPYAIVRRDGRLMAFGGIWELWRPKDELDEPALRTCSIVTTAANAVLEPIHDRMPLVLGPDAWALWLDPATDMADVEHMMVPAPSDWLRAYPVSSRVNRVGNDGPDLLDPLPDPPAGTLLSGGAL